jgi:hypothetical protein
METTIPAIPIAVKPIVVITCILCGAIIDSCQHEAHLILHEQAEMLADILALSRR